MGEMSTTPREIGTLIVVILKANHLPNKRHIGKQDPYCVVTVNGEKRRTKAIKRGGQHPEWDEEIRFILYEDTDDVLTRTAKPFDGTPPPLPPKEKFSLRNIKGGKIMKLTCFADDAREPDFIGEADVDLTEVLTKGETDEWFTLNNKDKFAGKVYLELTFWSNEPPPEKKVTPKPTKNNRQYGGPGSFIPSGERVPGQHLSRTASASAGYPSTGPPDLYVAPYEQHNQRQLVDSLAQDFGEFGINHGHHRRESFPPVGHSPHYSQASYNGYATDTTLGYSYDRPPSPGTQSSFHLTNQPYQYQPPYDPNASAQYPGTGRGPRQSIPASSSGFVPLPQSSGFVPIQPGVVDPYAPPISHTPSPAQYGSSPSQFIQSGPYPQTQSPVTYVSSTPAPYQNPSPVGSQPYSYQPYPFPQSNNQAPQSYYPSQGPPPMHSPHTPTQPQAYQTYPQGVQDPPLPLPNPAPPTTVGGSRPLPPQPIVYGQPPPPPPLVQNGGYSPPQQHSGSISPGRIPPSTSLPLPLPPPPPPGSFVSNHPGPPVPPPPPPQSVVTEVRQRRQSALPQPPVIYQQPAYQQPNPDGFVYNRSPNPYNMNPGLPQNPPGTPYNSQ
ncbi:hypothetical protein FA15DRAFT_632252 [Coprinopsis marcescibilis]|uniref:C2 domain-containing protein n=1 Tax=Coprinopsis marcescibilis TaxID=230819 RepID=A0A5C3L957_COPMA|nr:hypothetical protein FA15DRAFT_632252 [Coprinopsis marcescibilis]